MELGKLYNVPLDEELYAGIEFFHVHSLANGDKWEVGEILNTNDFNRTESYNIYKKMREKVFEDIRVKLFFDYPTRSKCLFLSIGMEEVNIWKPILSRGIGAQVFKIKLCSGSFIILDESVYELENFSDKDMKEDAIDYWDGVETNKPKLAVLFEGTYKLLDEL